MKAKFFRRLSLGVAAAVMLGACAGTAEAVSSLSKPGEEIENSQPQADAKVESNLPDAAPEAPEVRFTISNVRLDAQELKLNKEVLARILSQSVGVETTLSAFNQTVDKVTAYCRSNGYPASAAFLPVQESKDGTVTIKVIPGRYGEVRIENNSRLSERVIRGFLHGLKKGDIIRTASLETALYSISDISGAKAIGVLSPGKDFGTSDLTVRVEDGKRSNTVLYAENYGSKNSGEYRFGVQESLYNVGGTGARMNLGAMVSNEDLHNYYLNYETVVGHGGTKLGLGFSRMDYMLSIPRLDANGTAHTISLFGSRPIFHLDNRKLAWRFGYDYRNLKDNLGQFAGAADSKKHSHSVHVGLEGYNRWQGTYLDFSTTLTAGTLGTDSDFARQQAEAAKTNGGFTKLEASATGVQALGHQTDVMLKLSGQAAFHNLDSSEDFYLGGANGVRAYPQGEASGDEGVLGTLELRYHTKLPGLTLSTYFDAGTTRSLHRSVQGWNSTTTLKGWGIGVSYTRPNDWFARFDYARRIGGYENMTSDAKSKDRMWFILGKIW
ncbi:MAG: ShlB/FhaC/HecB family hemolysin secretion/activation protein [Selenomonadaceae bacterium]|nr:ShlB/FhaC/HecB family hemolysin secretion/activation protein [Selenomonadaceae bacterium]